MKVLIVQTTLHWEQPEINRTHIAKLISEKASEADLVVLPEMFTSGFTMNPKLVAETMLGDTIKWMRKLSQQYQTAITGSLVILENGHYYNRLVFVHPNGDIDQYDKRHTFALAREHEHYTAGTQQVIINYMGWRICPLICYDLRFPVWSRNTQNYDILLYVANWPEPRVNAWDALLKARAIENMSYCVGVNRVGKDGNDHNYVGHSGVYDILGHKIDKLILESENVALVTLEKEQVQSTRDKLRFLDDMDGFEIIN
ncbi:amidohydrolase [Paucihalobacter sp.]|uniref:amidohydrolase n=1 Tax=Paucihalobacter sp. TaxID=2850405 RepID=UPI003D161232